MNDNGQALYPDSIPETSWNNFDTSALGGFAFLNTEAEPTQTLSPLSDMETVVLSTAGIAVAAGALILGRRWWRDRDTQHSIKKAIKGKFGNDSYNNNNKNGPSNHNDEESKSNYNSMNNNSSQNQLGFSGQAKLIGKA